MKLKLFFGMKIMKIVFLFSLIYYLWEIKTDDLYINIILSITIKSLAVCLKSVKKP